MFRFLVVIALAIIVIDRALSAIQSGRVSVTADWHIARVPNPIGYWLMTSFWLSSLLLFVCGLVFLAYCAITGSGPYANHAFFSMHQAWPLGVVAVPMLVLAGVIVRDWVILYRYGRYRDAA